MPKKEDSSVSAGAWPNSRKLYFPTLNVPPQTDPSKTDPEDVKTLPAHFITRRDQNLHSISRMDSAGEPEAVPCSRVSGLNLSEPQRQTISNGQFFEAGSSMAILDSPGEVAKTYDTYATRLATLLSIPFDNANPVAQKLVNYQGKTMFLSEAFEKALVVPLSSSSDQIGRQPSSANCDIRQWLLETLRQPMVDEQSQCRTDYEFATMLTKIRALAAFGAIVWELMNPPEPEKQEEGQSSWSEMRKNNQEVIRSLLEEAFPDGKMAGVFDKQFKEFLEKTHTRCFDDPISRARSERMPMVKLNGCLTEVHGKHEDASKYGLGFGQVIQDVEDGAPNADQQRSALRTALGQNNEHINSILRQGAPISDMTRPFMMSEEEMGNIPAPYAQLGIEQKLRAHAYEHGTGLNRWRTYGTFSSEASKLGLPSAGSQSGTTCGILLALNTLSDKPLYGNAGVVLPATLGIAAFMNFGAYHTFTETFPIGEAMAKNRPYFPHNLPSEKLYKRFIRAANTHVGPEAAKAIASFQDAYKTVQTELNQQYPDFEQSPESWTISFYEKEKV